MKRHLFNLLAAVSLVMCVATLATWGLSVCRFAAYSFDAFGRSISVATPRHALRVERVDQTGYYYFNTPGFSLQGPLDNATLNEFLGFDVERVDVGYRYCGLGFKLRYLQAWQSVSHSAEVPFWFAICLFAILPLRWAQLAHRTHRKQQSRCAACGYNLTGNVSGVCPECGTAISAPSTAPDAKEVWE